MAAVVFVSGCTQQGNNTTQQNNTTVQQNATNTSAKTVDVVAIQSGPAEAKKGDNVNVTYEVSNKGTETVYNVQIVSQDFEQNVGTLIPGETRKYTGKSHIPTDAEVQQNYKTNSTVPNPFFIGGFGVLFNDAKGSKYTIKSNDLEIKLV